jgi:hypothetical protein
MKFESILRRYAEVARPEILRDFRADSCIASTRITIRVMREFGIFAEPLSVIFIVGNAEWRRRIIENQEPWPDPKDIYKWCEMTGAWSVGVGNGRKREGGWPGHLVAYLPKHNFIIDASIDQANRPAKGIILPPVLIAQISPRFAAGEIALESTSKWMYLQYACAPNELFRLSKDWTEFQRIKPVVKRIMRHMKNGK